MKEVIVRVGDSAFRGGFIPDDLEINRNIKDMQDCLEEINKLIIRDTNELYIRELLNRIDKAIKFIQYFYGDMKGSFKYDELIGILKGEK